MDVTLKYPCCGGYTVSLVINEDLNWMKLNIESAYQPNPIEVVQINISTQSILLFKCIASI